MRDHPGVLREFEEILDARMNAFRLIARGHLTFLPDVIDELLPTAPRTRSIVPRRPQLMPVLV
jgi:hypothetical protein